MAIAPGPHRAPGYETHLRQYFRTVHAVATLPPGGTHTIESGGHVYVCTDPVRPWGTIWPELRNYA
ncbi:hypothetical protein [Yinghuangia sp. YIM S09857]|uniref:hypothetical protein n=1 Tax=Yinghuangia sp. YIM S09857 TaxID=3436929 RepID=UPI003F52E47C